MADFPYNMDDCLRLLGVSHNNSKNIRVKCPVCGRKDFTVNRENEKFSCYHCDLKGRSATSLYAQVHHIDNSSAYKEIIEALNCNGNVRSTPKPAVTYEEDTPIADIRSRHIAYSIMLSHLSLSKRDTDDLLKRGFLIEEIKKLGYKSAIGNDNESTDSRIFKIPKEIIARGINPFGIPPFFKAKDKDIWVLSTYKNGILVPYKSRNNLLQGFQLRKHNEELAEGEKKYSWVSSVNKHMGTASKSYIHYACDFAKNEKNYYEPILNGDSILLTEGAMKGDLFHCITGFPAICVAGVNSLSELDAELDYLKSRGIKYILIAYDMDYETKPKVATAVETLKNKIENHGLSWQRILWDNTWKGIDDYYAFHERGIK